MVEDMTIEGLRQPMLASVWLGRIVNLAHADGWNWGTLIAVGMGWVLLDAGVQGEDHTVWLYEEEPGWATLPPELEGVEFVRYPVKDVELSLFRGE